MFVTLLVSNLSPKLNEKDVLFENADPRKEVLSLMTRDKKSEADIL